MDDNVLRKEAQEESNYGFSFFSEYYGDGHPIHLKWPQYRSCCTPIDSIYSLPAALVLIPLPKSPPAVCFVHPAIMILWKQATMHARLLSYHIYRASMVVATVLAQHGTVLTVFTHKILTELYLTGTEKLCGVNV